jgi:soluble lytic murein transglycosylase
MKPGPQHWQPARVRAAALALATLLLLPLPAIVGAKTPVPASAVTVANGVDEAVLAARVAAADGDVDRVAALAPQVAGTLLAPYLDYWQASLRLRGQNPDDSLVRPFLARYAGTALADRLRADWLLALGSKGDFATFDAERHHLVIGGEDPQLSCYFLLARYALNDGQRREQIVREARRNLASTTDPGGDGCTALAERLLNDGVLSIWPRLQALVERNQIPAAEQAAARLSPADAIAIKRLLGQPGAWLAGVEAHLDRMPHSLPLLAIVALARDAPDDAAKYAERIDPALTPEERAIVWGRIGRLAQLKLLPEAHGWFGRGGDLVGVGIDYVRPVDVLEARARAALRRGAGSAAPGASSAGDDREHPVETDSGPDWTALRKAIARMSPDQQADPTWVYWNAQALMAQDKIEEARAGLRSISDRFSYYGRLAAEQLDLPLVLAPRPEAPASELVDELAQRPGFLRARKLYELGMREEGTREWNWELRGMDDASLHAAAELGRRLGVLDRMIASSERTRTLVDVGQRYPMPYRDLMAATVAPLAVDPAWIYGLIRQESRFIEDVRSNVGAIGLMQLMPSTARFVAHRIGFENYRADRVADVQVNLRLGTEYLKLVFDDQDGQALLASAAYNAGPHRVRKWRAALARPLDGALFVETIPIEQTRDYVKHVLFNTLVYGALLDHPAESLRSMLGPVTPQSTAASDLP